jgi:twitching motility protein PilI
MSIKEYQRSLSEQLNNANQTTSAATVLGIALGEDRCLIHMHEVSEVIQTPKITPVSLTQPWFIGMTNVRGNLYGITDLGVFLGGSPTPFNFKSRILLVSTNYKINSGFLVNSMLGIRDLSDFKRTENTQEAQDTDTSRYYMDKEQRQWRELSLHELIHNEKFFQIAQ